MLFQDALLARIVAAAAWIVAALHILGLLGATLDILDRAALTIGTVRLSLLLVAKAALLIAIPYGRLWRWPGWSTAASSTSPGSVPRSRR